MILEKVTKLQAEMIRNIRKMMQRHREEMDIALGYLDIVEGKVLTMEEIKINKDGRD